MNGAIIFEYGLRKDAKIIRLKTETNEIVK